MQRTKTMTALILALFASAASAQQWTAEKVATMDGFDTPESVAPAPDGEASYVSNIVIGEGSGPWADDGTGYLSKLRGTDAVAEKKWRESSTSLKLNAPKGVVVHGDSLWVADNSRVIRFPLGGGPGRVIEVPGAERLNDMASDGQAVYVSDTATGTIHRLTAHGEHREIQGPPAVNGITVADGKMYAVSFGEHEVYEVDPSGEGEPKPFGLADHFQALDGIEVLEDGSILVSDFPGNKVSVIAPDHKTVRTLIETQTPADIGLDRENMLLYVPSFMGDFVEVYKLQQ